jgi:hypothetical protein
LLKHIELHRYSLARAGAKITDESPPPLRQALRQAQEAPQGAAQETPSPSLVEAAADWYDHIYLPMIRIVRETAVIGHFPGRSETDLYRWLIQHQAELRQQHDLAQVEMPEAVQEFLEAVE